MWSRVGLFGYPLSFGVGVLVSAYAIDLRSSLAGGAERTQRAARHVELSKTSPWT